MSNTLTIYEGRDGRYSFLPFYLPEGKSGNCTIRYEIAKKGEKLTVVSLRNAIFMRLITNNK
jgi:hypothetical protein